MRRPIRTLTAALAALTVCAPAFAAPPEAPVALWGGSGLILVPTTHVLDFNAMQLTGGYLGQLNQPLLGFHAGLLKDLEAGVTYPAPNSGGALAANVKYRLLQQSATLPFSLAVGGMNLGLSSPAATFGLSNQLYLMLGHDLKWAFGAGKPVTIGRAALGFAGNLAGAELLAGVQIPVLEYGSLEAEYVGNRPGQDALLNVGLTVTPLPWLGLRFASIGDTATAPLSREWYAGVHLAWDVPSSGLPFAKASAKPETTAKTDKKPVPAPPVVSPPPTPADKKPSQTAANPDPSATPTPEPTATPAPEGTVQGRVQSGDKAVARIPLQLNGGVTRKAWSEADGTFVFPKVPVGTYKLKVDRTGWKPFEQDVVVVASGKTDVKVALVALPATFKGIVYSAPGKGVGGITVSIEELGISTLTKDDGTFTLPDLPAGSHTVTYYRKKELVDKVTLNLAQGETLQRNLTLKPGAVPTVAKALMRGTITDGSKAPLAGARITLEGKELTVMTISGPDGGFILRELPAGTYKLSVSKSGFKSRYFSLTLKSGQEVRHAIALTAGN